jgi:hypothetical protein
MRGFGKSGVYGRRLSGRRCWGGNDGVGCALLALLVILIIFRSTNWLARDGLDECCLPTCCCFISIVFIVDSLRRSGRVIVWTSLIGLGTYEFPTFFAETTNQFFRSTPTVHSPDSDSSAKVPHVTEVVLYVARWN